MNSTWQDYLIKAGAVLNHDGTHYFAPIKEELEAARTATVLADLSNFALITVSGADATTFLQGQFTNDISKASEARAQHSGYCSPKGRLLANFLVWRHASEYFLQMPSDIAPMILKRLSMFVLRAKVFLQDKSAAFVCMGVAGINADQIIRDVFSVQVPDNLSVSTSGGVVLIRLAPQRFEIITPLEIAPSVWEKLVERTQPVGANIWTWINIEAGLPLIGTATQDQFVPQMINFELLGGVDFKKGCYTGQEIVARTQYLGKLKRRLYSAHLRSDTAPLAGDSLYSADLGEQASGTIVNVAPSPDGGFALLASIHNSSVATQTIHWKTLAGPPLQMRSLPYPDPASA